MLISAYWHGLHAGYYLSFMTIPLCIAAESAMEASVRSKLGPRGQNVFDWIHWFLKMRAYDYMCMGFVLLKASDTIYYWSSIYFVMHIIAVCCILVGGALKGGKRAGRRGEREQTTEGERLENMKEKSGEKTDWMEVQTKKRLVGVPLVQQTGPRWFLLWKVYFSTNKE